MTASVSTTTWEKLGAAEGLWAAILLTAQLFVMHSTTADLRGDDAGFVLSLEDERLKWELITLLRLIAGLMIVWFMGSLAGRLRLAEGEPGRLATIAFGLGVVWGGMWLVAALFNSVAILFATDYDNEAAARVAATLSVETAYVLTPAILVALTFATALVALRFGGFPSWYAWLTFIASGVFLLFAITDWWGPGTLSDVILGLALAWTAVTSAILIPTYRASDGVEGTKGAPA